MADFTSIAAVGSSLERYLNLCFEERPPIVGQVTRAQLVRTEDIDKGAAVPVARPSLSLYLYRVDFNKTMRAAWSGVAYHDGESHLPLDLHFLFIAWADNADYEYRITGRAMQCMENTPILTGPLLDPITNWSTGDAVQVCLEDIPTQDVMHIFDSLPLDYKLSIPYVARVVVMSGQQIRQAQPVTQQITRVKTGGVK
ncbi:MAG: DUF4255 domain-containing protein [Gammaproteobacteria bacterium]|nr:DUF4255 domain-containing protein [Gammaproteobacteria bacterium]